MTAARPTSSSSVIVRLALLIAAVAFVVLMVIRLKVARPQFEGLAVGETAPAISGNGWLNGPGPEPDDLKGKVVVVEAWASW